MPMVLSFQHPQSSNVSLSGGKGSNRALPNAKIALRRRDCERMLAHEARLPKYLKGTRRIDLDAAPGEAAVGNALRGIPTSIGKVTGTARVVKALKDIGCVQPGDILVVNATDPGWGPVFVTIGGIVPETGGMLSHASCLAREYGLPAVQLAGAVKLTPDGATITVDGDSGVVTIVRSNDDLDEESESKPARSRRNDPLRIHSTGTSAKKQRRSQSGGAAR